MNFEGVRGSVMICKIVNHSKTVTEAGMGVYDSR